MHGKNHEISTARKRNSFLLHRMGKLENGYGLPDINNADSIMAGFTCKPDTMTETKFEELRKYIEPIMVYAGLTTKDKH